VVQVIAEEHKGHSVNIRDVMSGMRLTHMDEVTRLVAEISQFKVEVKQLKEQLAQAI
jgi:uncharacterized membrane protein YjjP (DUF1212 family)